MKRFLALILAVIMAATIFGGCSSAPAKDDGKLNIVTTIFPEYDWVSNITSGAEDVNITLLLENGADMHSYQPTAEDIVKISSCDVFIYVGGESDKWVDDALKGATNKEMTVINLLDILGTKAKEEETVEGMQADKEEKGGKEEAEEEAELDEHVWLSLKNASMLCGKISDKLSEKDSKNKELYSKNTENYLKKLNELDARYKAVRDSAKYDTLIFADRFPFRYLIDDYNLKYYAAFSGCSAESEASFETVAFLAKKLDELKLPALMKIDGSDGKIANTVLQTSNQKNAQILELDSMQSVNKKDIEDGKTYLSIMESNLAVFTQAVKG
ncbi:MAG: metal ABC transporter substrate-binding protein [Oscillospiraceae bacterium]|nr:metal ABC transporter substrate-binding protein [Oscillospiraceae bacterium]